jgi:glycosyltransferase involved in cell wall biosynthesis
VSVSWLIPVRNGAQWLRDAVESALSECTGDDEVIVVDDGSTDDPRGAVPLNPRVVWLSQPALGITSALENGRAHCRHTWIARLDADDVALPGRISAQRKVLESNSNIAVVGGRAEMFRDDGPVPEGMAHYVDWVNGLTDLHRQLLVESPLFHPAVLMRASALDDVGGYRDGDLPEDYDLWLRLHRAGFALSAVSECVVRLRDRSDRLTRTDPRYRREAFDSVKREWLETGPLSKRRRLAIWGAGRTGKRWLRWLLASGHQVEAVIDVHHRTERQGVPIYGPDALSELDVEYLLVAVGARGARETIRKQVCRLRPGWVEGEEWWALA